MRAQAVARVQAKTVRHTRGASSRVRAGRKQQGARWALVVGRAQGVGDKAHAGRAQGAAKGACAGSKRQACSAGGRAHRHRWQGATTRAAGCSGERDRGGTSGDDNGGIGPRRWRRQHGR